MKLQTKILTAFLLIVAASLIGGTSLAINELNSVLLDKQEDEISHTMDTVKVTFNNLAKQAGAYANLIDTDERISRSLVDNNRGQAVQTVARFFRHAKDDGLDYLMLTDSDGKVFVAGHDLRRFGEDIKEWSIIREALSGEAGSGTRMGKQGMLHLTSGPVRDSLGNIVGAIVAGYIIDNEVVDQIKEATGAEITFFKEPEPSRLP